MTRPADTHRLRGLDTLRAVAIALVLMTHYEGFVAHARIFGVVGSVGWAGVDLFFVLSGYLIGNQILAPVSRGETFSLKVFFARRLLRTLPNYYAVLAVYLLLPHSAISGSASAPVWRFLTFTQNFGLAYGQTFTHSWSLCIEEQFYVILPLAVLVLARWGRSVRLAWCVLGAAIAAGMSARAFAWLAHGYDGFAAAVYYSSFCRSDELLFGVAIAMLRNFHGDRFARLQRHGNTLLAAGLGAAAAVLCCLANDLPNVFVTTAIGFSLVAASFALLTCAALSPQCLLNRLWIPGASNLALWSYAVYLVHKPVFMAIRPSLERLGIDAQAPLTVLAVMAAGVFGGWLLFQFVETPFMRLRARRFPSNRPGRAAVVDAVPASGARHDPSLSQLAETCPPSTN
jgi:peptidoglycan/LPS O-acetylase OafA/YrhL